MQVLLTTVVVLGQILTTIAFREYVTFQSWEPTFIFTYPQIMLSGSNVKACVTLYNFTLPVVVKVSFTKNRCLSSSQTGCNNIYSISKVDQCINLEVPIFRNEIVHDILKISFEGNKGKIIKEGRKDVILMRKRNMVFVETDHTVYKPGDKVRIRMFLLEFSLIPAAIQRIDHVILYGPKQEIIKEWLNLPTASGVAIISHKLQGNAEPGYWKLEVNGVEKATFEVRLFTYMHFEVTLKHPEHFFWGDKTVLQLCAVYTFNKPVRGFGMIKTTLTNSKGREKVHLSTRSDELLEGCLEMELNSNNFPVNNGIFHRIMMFGTVTESSTNSTATVTNMMTVNSASYDMLNEVRKLKPGLPFSGKLHIRDKNIVAIKRKVQVCYTHREFRKPKEICKDFVITNEEVLPFTIPPLKRVQHHITVKAYIENIDDKKFSSRPSIQLQPFYSVTNNSIEIMSLDQSKLECGQTATFKIMYTLNNIRENRIRFIYMLVSRDEILNLGSKTITPKQSPFDPKLFENVIISNNDLSDNSVHFDHFNIDIKLGDKVYTKSKLIVYFVTNGEVIADDIVIDIKDCLPNRVEAEWESNDVTPNSENKLKIKTTYGSVCSITTTDISRKFMRKSNLLTTESVLEPFNILDIKIPEPNEWNCLKPNSSISDSDVIWFNGIHMDTYHIFSTNKIGVISNLQVITRPCSLLKVRSQKHYTSEVKHLSDEPIDILPMPAPMTQLRYNSQSAIRTYFPQTWLWEILMISDSETKYDVIVPGSITRWITNVLCLNSEGGIGIGNVTDLVVKKMFFIELLFPYSVKKNIEIVRLVVVMHNYYNYSIPVILTLQPNIFLRNIYEEPTSAKYCLEPLGIASHVFNFTVLHTGAINISVNAEKAPEAILNCSTTDLQSVQVQDTVQKSLKVEAEVSKEEHILNTTLICDGEWGKEGERGFYMNFPGDEMIMNVKAEISIDTNLLSPLIENVKTWVQEPKGTVDDIIHATVTNYYALEYLKLSRANNSKLKESAIQHLQVGVEMLYKYFHNDGMFAINSNTDTFISIFHTAFLLKLFGLIKSYVYIEKAIIVRGIMGLSTYQRQNGCFNIASLEKETDVIMATLTAYVTISFIETKVVLTHEQMKLAEECLLADENLDSFGLAITSYALFLLGNEKNAVAKLEKLLNDAVKTGNILYWKQANVQWGENTVDVEVAGYALMSLLYKPKPEYVNYAASIVKWLLTNPQQGRYTTQHIVVIMEGVRRFVDFVNSAPNQLTVDIDSYANGRNIFKLQPGVQWDTRTIKIDTIPDLINIKTKGRGCVLSKSELDFSSYESNIHLNITSKIEDFCKCTISLRTCVYAETTESSFIGILKVLIPHGYAVNETSIEYLDKSLTGMNKYEYVDHNVILYFAGIAQSTKCANFIIQETVEVQHKTNITMKLHSYYAADAEMQHTYPLPSCNLLDSKR